MRYLPAFFSVLGPTVVLAVGVAGVAAWEPQPERMEQREIGKAGRVMNGRLLRRSVVEEMEEILARSEPDVVILGNSVANTNVDPDLLAEALAIPRRKIATLSVPNSVGTHWYAILKNRVYANGHEPPLIIVVSPIQTMLLVQPYSESGYLNLVAQLGEDEPLVDAAVPRQVPLLRKLRSGRGALRDEALATTRDAAIGLVFGDAPDPGANTEAMGRVFDDALVDMSLYGAALPVSETREMSGQGPEAVPHPDDSFLAPLLHLATENRSKVVFLRTPMAPRTPPEEADVVLPGWEEAAQALIAAKGHTLADLSSFPMPDSLFYNSEHMTTEGATTMTRALVQIIDDHRLYTKRVPFIVPQPPAVTVTGPTEPAPGAEALATQFDGRWLGPGGRLVATFDTPWPDPRVWRVKFVAEQFGPGDSPWLKVAGDEIELERRSPRAELRRLLAEVSTSPPTTTPWKLEFAVPEGGAPVLIEGLSFGRGPGAIQVIGRPEHHEAAHAELLGRLELRDGVVTLGEPDTVFAAAPPDIAGANRKMRASAIRQDTAMFHAPDLAVVSDARTPAIHPLQIRCSPVQVLEDGVPLPRPHETCADEGAAFLQGRRGVAWPPGRVCHAPNGRIVFSSSDGAPVADTPRTYELALDPERACAGGRWLYPGDHVEIRAPADLLDAFRGGARALLVTAASADGRRQVLPIRVRVGDEIVLRDVLFPAGPGPVKERLALDRPLWPGEGPLVVEIDNPGQGWALVTSATLVVGQGRTEAP